MSEGGPSLPPHRLPPSKDQDNLIPICYELSDYNFVRNEIKMRSWRGVLGEPEGERESRSFTALLSTPPLANPSSTPPPARKLSLPPIPLCSEHRESMNTRDYDSKESTDYYSSESCGSNASSISSGTLSSKWSEDSGLSAVDLAEASIDRYYRNNGEFYDLDSVELGVQECELEEAQQPRLGKEEMEQMAESIISMITDLKLSLAAPERIDDNFILARGRPDPVQLPSPPPVERNLAHFPCLRHPNFVQRGGQLLSAIPETQDHIYEEIIGDSPIARVPRPPPLPDRNQFSHRLSRGRMSVPIREHPLAKKLLEFGSLRKKRTSGADDSLIFAFNERQKAQNRSFNFLRKKHRSVPNLAP